LAGAPNNHHSREILSVIHGQKTHGPVPHLPRKFQQGQRYAHRFRLDDHGAAAHVAGNLGKMGLQSGESLQQADNLGPRRILALLRNQPITAHRKHNGRVGRLGHQVRGFRIGLLVRASASDLRARRVQARQFLQVYLARLRQRHVLYGRGDLIRQRLKQDDGIRSKGARVHALNIDCA
jgi:hypothetical protein